MSIEKAALVSGAVNYLLIDGQTKCLKSLQETDLITIELGNFTNQLQNILGKTNLTDIFLVLGIGGAAAYIWKQTFSDLSSNHDQLSSNNFFHWLFSEERLRGEGFQGGKRDGGRETCCSDLPVGGDRSHTCLGLNILTGDNQNKKEHFLKQRLFDVRSSDTSRFMPDRRKMVRGSPDGGEDSQLADPERLVSRNGGYRRCSVSSGMEKIMKKAKDVRKLIREASFDSLASEFLLDIEFDTVSLDDASVTEDVTVTSDTEEYVLDRNIFNRFKSNEAWRLVNSTRESSLFSEKEFSLDDKHFHSISGYGYTSEDLGSTSDAWEWDDEYLLEDLTSCPQSELRREQSDSAWLPDYSQELDLELELSGPNHSGAQEVHRVPPSGSSSVE